MAKVFQLLNIVPLVVGGTFIEWQLHPLFRAPQTHTFTVQYSATGAPGSTDWVTVGTLISGVGTSPTTRYSLTDINQRRFTNADRGYYRVKLVASDATEYLSEPKIPLQDLDRQNRLHAKYIARMELLRMKQAAGVCGYLFKRKYWGERCTAGCLDPQTNEVLEPSCPECLGTGWTGGYATPIPFWIDFESGEPNKISTGEIGQKYPQPASARALWCPEARTNDIFLDPGSDDRWIVMSNEVKAQIRNTPLIGELQIRLVEPTSILSLLTKEHVG